MHIKKTLTSLTLTIRHRGNLECSMAIPMETPLQKGPWSNQEVFQDLKIRTISKKNAAFHWDYPLSLRCCIPFEGIPFEPLRYISSMRYEGPKGHQSPKQAIICPKRSTNLILNMSHNARKGCPKPR